MVRINDPFWNDVEYMNDGSMKCKFCGHLFAEGTFISRIKLHLSGETGHEVGICGQVPKEVQEAAFLAMRGGNKRHKSIPSSSNVNDYAIPTCPQEQDNAGDAGRMQVGVQGMENTGEGSFQQVPTIGIYDVFLSFRGEDTRKTITDHLYSALIQAGIHSFRDDNELPRGEEISPQLLRAIEGSRISIVVFSRNYASSRWCLDELVKIMECRQKTHQVVLPIFYDTDPSDVRKQTGSYAKAFDEHEEHFKEEKEKVNRWREALTQAANLSGRVLHNETNGYEAELIKRVVSDVACKLRNKNLHVAKHPVGISSRVRGVISLLTGARNNVGIVGIYGIAGIGKTTIAKAVFNNLYFRFEGSSFLLGVKEISDKPTGLVELQERLLHDILKSNVWKISNIYEGMNLIKERLHRKNILVVFDDVDKREQLEALMGERCWFGDGSKIIIVTKNKHLLTEVEVDGMYHAMELDRDQSLQLFSLHAFRETRPAKDYEELSEKVVDYCKGLPLVLKILGSHLSIRDKAGWEIDIAHWRNIPHDDIQAKLRATPGTEQEQHLERRSSCERPSINQADEPRGDSSQPSDPMCLDHGRYYEQPFAPSVSNDVIMNDVQNMVRVRTEPVEEHDVENSGGLVQPGTGARSSRFLKDNTSETRGVPFTLRSNKPVGQAFEENTKQIWSLLMDDEVSTIGIYGMGGIGKTTILQHIHNELLQRPDICDHIWWVTVSKDFSINRLQNLIAKCLDLNLSREDDDLHRAAKLSKELRKKQKWILILDDLWNNFELHEVGIPIPLKGCKLILTTRSQTVCAQIDCQCKIEVKPLFEEESWTLFKENLGRHMALSDEVEGIAKVVARECDGLPLGIITVARSLMGRKNLNEWRNTLKELGESRYMDMNEKVFKVLRVSYDRLDDRLPLQKCLLYCALFPEDELISTEELIGYLIDEGIIKGVSSRQIAIDEGHTMLNKLQYVCLLENVDLGDEYGKHVRMHDMIRDMAIQILQQNSQVMVKAGAQLEELPDAEEWTENLTKVSLMQNNFEEIPPSHSPMCPNLSTLLLCQNLRLVFIADSFFKQLHGLKLLDLSHTDIEKLPDSVSDLVSLSALLLNYCLELTCVPSLEKLTALKRLDLYRTSLEKMPQGMECLSSLRYFRIDGYGEEEFPSRILPKLIHLQVLTLGEFPTECFTVEGMEVGCLEKLETLECRFKGFSDFVEYCRSRDGTHSLSTYKLLVGTMNAYWIEYDGFPSKTVMLGHLSINRDRDFQVKFVNDIQGLYCECIDARSLCDVLSLENATELEIINIENCDSMETLVSSSWFYSAPPPLPSHNGMFSCVKKFCCVDCKSMENLFPLELLSYLVNLEDICVGYCEKMEEIIGTADEKSSTSNPIAELTLPKLDTLELRNLPELKRICSGKLICNSLELIEVFKCKKLKRMAISLPLLENGQPSPHPSLKRIRCSEKWWETVEWEPPNAKEVLRPIAEFTEDLSSDEEDGDFGDLSSDEDE